MRSVCIMRIGLTRVPLIEVMSYIFYLSIVLVLWRRIERLHLTARV